MTRSMRTRKPRAVSRKPIRKRTMKRKNAKRVNQRKKSKRVNQRGDGIFSVLVPLIATAISAAATA